MQADPATLFDDWAARVARGESPDPREYLDQAGSAREELAQLMDAYLQAAPRREPDPETVELARTWLRAAPRSPTCAHDTGSDEKTWSQRSLTASTSRPRRPASCRATTMAGVWSPRSLASEPPAARSARKYARSHKRDHPGLAHPIARGRTRRPDPRRHRRSGSGSAGRPESGARRPRSQTALSFWALTGTMQSCRDPSPTHVRTSCGAAIASCSAAPGPSAGGVDRRGPTSASQSEMAARRARAALPDRAPCSGERRRTGDAPSVHARARARPLGLPVPGRVAPRRCSAARRTSVLALARGARARGERLRGRVADAGDRSPRGVRGFGRRLRPGIRCPAKRPCAGGSTTWASWRRSQHDYTAPQPDLSDGDTRGCVSDTLSLEDEFRRLVNELRNVPGAWRSWWTAKTMTSWLRDWLLLLTSRLHSWERLSYKIHR